jgi:phage terminase large subunit-like protein
MHPAEQYIHDVLGGKIVVGRWVKLAVERHVRDLRGGAARGFHFDRKKAERAIRFFGFLRHSKGEWAGKPFQLEPWQQFILWCVFGWRKADGTRRFRMVYVEVARKNGKSTFAAGVGLYLFAMDGEPGAEVYSAATKRDQAIIVHSEATRMVRASADLRQLIRVQKNNLSVESRNSKFEPLGADEDTMDGLNVHGAIVDELHAHKTRGVLDVLDSATGARRQPLILIITTAGGSRVGVCWDMHRHTRETLEGHKDADDFFGIIFAIDDEDDWRDPKVWAKANPSLGVSVKFDDLERKARRAATMLTYQNEVLRKHMNRWTEQVSRWLRMEKWRACADPVADETLRGRRCFAGLDLSSKLDITAVAYVFPPVPEDPRWRVKVRFMAPEEKALAREEYDRVPYHTWGTKEGLITLIPGDAIDDDHVLAQIQADAQVFQIVEVGYDPWNCLQLAIRLQSQGLNVIEIRQGFGTLNAPSKELEKLVVTGDLAHDGHRVLDWMAGNVATESDAAGNIKPSKKKSTEKIDGIAAIVTALARALVDTGEGDGKSVYDTRGVEHLG